MFAPVWCHSSVADSPLRTELNRGCSSAASRDFNSQIPPKTEPRAASPLLPAPLLAPRSVWNVELLRAVSHLAAVGAVPVPSSHRCCHLIAAASWRFDPSHPSRGAWTPRSPGGQGVRFHLGFWLLSAAHWSCQPDVLVFTPLLHLLPYRVHSAPCLAARGAGSRPVQALLELPNSQPG